MGKQTYILHPHLSSLAPIPPLCIYWYTYNLSLHIISPLFLIRTQDIQCDGQMHRQAFEVWKTVQLTCRILEAEMRVSNE
jgi:hypothetical protein